MSGAQPRVLSSKPPKPLMTKQQAEEAILEACSKGRAYRGIDALLAAINERAETTRLSRQDARAVLTKLREEEKISPHDHNIHSL